MEDRELGRDPVEVLQRGPPVHRYVSAGSWREGEVAAQDRPAGPGIDLCQTYGVAAAMPQHHPSLCGTDITHPVRVPAQHGH